MRKVILPPEPFHIVEELWFAVGDLAVSWKPRASLPPAPLSIGDRLADRWFR